MAYIYDLSDTWNAGGTTFYGIKMNVTNSASAAGSRLLSLQVSGSELFGVDKNGNVGAPNYYITDQSTSAAGVFGFASGSSNGPCVVAYGSATAGAGALAFQTGGAERARFDVSGNFGLGTSSPTCALDIASHRMRLRTASTPSSASATGDVGEIRWDSSYIYICIATNTWKRAALATW